MHIQRYIYSYIYNNKENKRQEIKRISWENTCIVSKRIYRISTLTTYDPLFFMFCAFIRGFSYSTAVAQRPIEGLGKDLFLANTKKDQIDINVSPPQIGKI